MTVSIADQIQALKDKNQALASTGPDEISQQEAGTLKDAWDNAVSVANAAPGDAADAEKAYYTYIDGDVAYRQRLIAQYNKEKEQLQSDLDSRYQEQEDTIQKGLSSYQSQLTYTDNTDKTKIYLLKQIKDLTQTMKRIRYVKDTNERKTFYLSEELKPLAGWNRLFRGLFIAFAAVCINIMIDTKDYKRCMSPR